MNNNNYVIIGASGGIGRQLTLDLQAQGANLFLGYHTNQPPDKLLKSAHYSQIDARSFEQTIKFIADAKQRLGNIDGVVSLPGAILLKSPHLVSESEFDKLVDTNLKTAFSVIRAVGKLLKNSSTILMSTAAVHLGLSNHEAIVASKAGIEAMVRSASVTYARKSIRFNAIAPGLVDTPLSHNIISTPSSLEYSKKLHVTGKIGTPQDISNMIQFLLNSNNQWITGQIFTIDGGLSTTKK